MTDRPRTLCTEVMTMSIRVQPLLMAALLLHVLVLRSAGADVGAVRVASGLSRPVYVTAPDGDSRLFIVEQGGLIRVLNHGVVQPGAFLDVSALLGGTVSGNDERGLLGLEFAPDFSTTSIFYINYTRLSDSRTFIERYQLSADPNAADPSSGETVFEIPQPFGNHNGGHLAFGADGLLYIGLGDGGSAGDPGNRAQSNDSLFAIILWFYQSVIGLESAIPVGFSHDLPSFAAKITVVLILIAVLGYLFYRNLEEDETAVLKNLFIMMALVFLFSPVQNPWYLCWVVPFLCIFPSRAWILLTGLVSLYYLDFYFDYQDLQSYRSWIEWVEYTPFFLLLGWEFKLKKYSGSKSTLRSS